MCKVVAYLSDQLKVCILAFINVSEGIRHSDSLGKRSKWTHRTEQFVRNLFIYRFGPKKHPKIVFDKTARKNCGPAIRFRMKDNNHFIPLNKIKFFR